MFAQGLYPVSLFPARLYPKVGGTAPLPSRFHGVYGTLLNLDTDPLTIDPMQASLLPIDTDPLGVDPQRATRIL